MPASSRSSALLTLCCILLLSLLVVWLPAFGRKPPPEPAADAVGYLNIAYHLAHHQVFADPGTPPTSTPPSGSMVAPLYLVVLALGAGILWRLVRRQPLLPVLLAGAALAIGYGVVIAPWLWRNHQLFGLTAITGPYGGYILAQRVAYNAMSAREWLASLLFWLPDFGDSLARLFFPADLLARLDWYSPDAYYVLGNGAWMREMLAQAGSKDALQGWVLREKVFADLPAHLAVTISLALRGLWVSKYFGLIGVVFWLPSLVRAVRRQQGLWLAFCAPAIVLLGLQAFVSVSIPRYNLLVIPCMAIAAAPLLLAWGQGLSRTMCRLFNKKG
ncbi:hypothetical protein [Insolitispirillum peregrinum]